MQLQEELVDKAKSTHHANEIFVENIENKPQTTLTELHIHQAKRQQESLKKACQQVSILHIIGLTSLNVALTA